VNALKYILDTNITVHFVRGSDHLAPTFFDRFRIEPR